MAEPEADANLEDARSALPAPPLSMRLELPRPARADEGFFAALPAKPGVLAIESEAGAALSLITTANLRRAAVSRLAAAPEAPTRSARANLREVARFVAAAPVGSAFEADWAFLQLARRRLPRSYRSMVDRWQAWFITCDAAARFPQWSKSPEPDLAGATSAVFAGPMADKHAAARLMEMLENAFDLCRYHHILVQAPHATACAYKEMGKCPAPCDGSISLERYGEQVRESIDFARDPAAWRGGMQRQMSDRSAAQDFEAAQRCKAMLQRTALAGRREFERVRDLQQFRFLAVTPAGRDSWARLIAIDRGWIEPLMDVRCKAAAEQAPAIAEVADGWMARERRFDGLPSRALIENIGVVCRHMLRPQRSAAGSGAAEFLHADRGGIEPATIAAAIARLSRKGAKASPSASPAQQPTPADQEIECVEPVSCDAPPAGGSLDSGAPHQQ